MGSPKAASKSFLNGFLFRQVVLLFLSNWVAGSKEPGVPIPILVGRSIRFQLASLSIKLAIWFKMWA